MRLWLAATARSPPTADELLIVLLSHENREVVFLACGVLINMVGEQHTRDALLAASGIRMLLEVSPLRPALV